MKTIPMAIRATLFLSFVLLAPLIALGDEPSDAPPVKVFILAGQSNMQGAGAIFADPNKENGGKGSLEYLVRDPATAEQFQHTVDADGEWIVRDDAWIWYLDRKGGL